MKRADLPRRSPHSSRLQSLSGRPEAADILQRITRPQRRARANVRLSKHLRTRTVNLDQTVTIERDTQPGSFFVSPRTQPAVEDQPSNQGQGEPQDERQLEGKAELEPTDTEHGHTQDMG